VEECGPCPVFASFTLAFALELRKKHEKLSVRLRKTLISHWTLAGFCPDTTYTLLTGHQFELKAVST